MTDAIWNGILVAIVGLAAICSPIFLAYLTNKNRRAEKEQDWARLDAVADKAEAIAKKAAAKVDEAARLLVESNEKSVEASRITVEAIKVVDKKADGIHTQLNSDKDAGLQSNLAALIGQQVALREIITLKKSFNQEPDPETDISMQAVAIRIEEIKTTIAARTKQAKIVEEQRVQQEPRKTAAPETAIADGKKPLPVADERVAVAAERSATAQERTADAAEEKARP